MIRPPSRRGEGARRGPLWRSLCGASDRSRERLGGMAPSGTGVRAGGEVPPRATDGRALLLYGVRVMYVEEGVHGVLSGTELSHRGHPRKVLQPCGCTVGHPDAGVRTAPPPRTVDAERPGTAEGAERPRGTTPGRAS